MPPAEFQPAIPAIKQLQTYALDRTATRIGRLSIIQTKIHGKRRLRE